MVIGGAGTGVSSVSLFLSLAASLERCFLLAASLLPSTSCVLLPPAQGGRKHIHTQGSRTDRQASLVIFRFLGRVVPLGGREGCRLLGLGLS